MAKGSRKKKNKKADFQKVKLKVGRKLPKGNVVDTTFKAKKIVIKEQIKLRENCTRTKFSDRDLKDCLSRISHHNDAMRLDALKNLKEMLLTDSSLIRIRIHQLIEKLSQLFTDKCSSVRNLTVSTLSTVISQVKDEQMIPFFPIVVSHLRCASTHLMYDIQKDALLIVDLLMEHFPQQVRHFSRSLLEDIVNQMSNQAPTSSSSSNFKIDFKNAQKEKKRKQSSGVLNVNLSFKVTSVSWHLQLCRRLSKILTNICKNLTNCEPLTESTQYFKWSDNEKMFFPVNNFIISTKKSSNCDRIANYFENADQFRSVISRITPLLCEMWVEAGSLSESMDRTNQSDNQRVEMYLCILEILRSIWMLVESWSHYDTSDLNTWFVKNFGNSVLQHCFKSFPLLNKEKVHFGQKLGKQRHTGFATVPVQKVNLLMCEVLFGFTPWIKTGEAKNLLHSCVNYIVDLLNNYGEMNNTVKLEILLSVIKRYVEFGKDDTVNDLLENIVKLLPHLTPGTTDLRSYLSFMSDILKDSRVTNFSVGPFLAQLPVILLKCNTVPWSLFDIMKHVGPRAERHFLASLESAYPKIIEKLIHLQVGNGNVEAAQRMIVDMLYWIPEINCDIFTSIAKLMCEQIINLKLSSFIIEVLSNRFRNVYDTSRKEERIIFISFLFTIALGCTQQHLDDATSSIENNPTSLISHYFDNYIPIIKDSPPSLVHQHTLTEMALNSLIGMRGAANLEMMAKVFFDKLFVSYKVVTLKCVHSLCQIMSQLWRENGPPNSILTHMSYIVVSYLEIIAADDNLSDLVTSVKDVMNAPGLLSCYVCNSLLLLSQGVIDVNAVNVMGEMTAILAKCCSAANTSVIHLILDNLKDRSNDPEVLPRWYAVAKYELKLCLMRNK